MTPTLVVLSAGDFGRTWTPDASGTTEALRVAAGLWFGGRVFDRQLDTDLAVMFVEGYGRHAFIDQAV